MSISIIAASVAFRRHRLARIDENWLNEAPSEQHYGYGADDAGGAGGRTSRMEEGLLRGRAGGGSINAPDHLATHTTDADATSWKRSRDLYASPVLHADGLEEVRTIVGIA